MLTLQDRTYSYLIQCYGTGDLYDREVFNKFNGKYPKTTISHVKKFVKTDSVLFVKKIRKH
jgi:hypothetical protein